MAIWYSYMHEGWVNDDDEDFFVDMTPEGGVLPDHYDTIEEFYNDGFEDVKHNPDNYRYKEKS